MSAVRNILFIMCDQLRADHLGCYGHPFLATTHLDELARRGVRFDRAFVRLKRRVTVTDEEVDAATAAHKGAGVFFGQW